LPSRVVHPCTVTPVLRERQVHGHDLVETARLPILDERFEHRRLQAVGPPLGERMADVSEKSDARLFEVGEVVGVVNDAHRVGLDEPHPDVMGELVIGGVDGRFDGQTHPPIFALRCPRPPVIDPDR